MTRAQLLEDQVNKRNCGALIGTAALSLVAIFGVAAPASASGSDCASSRFCLWDSGTYSGSPFVSSTFNTYNGQFDVTDNIASAGWNKKTSGDQYCGLNNVNIAWSVVVASWPINTQMSLGGTANNSIDDVAYRGSCTN